MFEVLTPLQSLELIIIMTFLQWSGSRVKKLIPYSRRHFSITTLGTEAYLIQSFLICCVWSAAMTSRLLYSMMLVQSCSCLIVRLSLSWLYCMVIRSPVIGSRSSKTLIALARHRMNQRLKNTPYGRQQPDSQCA